MTPVANLYDIHTFDFTVQVQRSFQINPKHFQKVATEFEKNYLTEFSID